MGHGNDFDVELSPAVHVRICPRAFQRWLAPEPQPIWGNMMRNTLIVGLAAIALAGCEHPTAPAGASNAALTSASSATTFSGAASVVKAIMSRALERKATTQQ